MATTDLALAVTTRSSTGTTASSALRRDGKVPGILFGHGSAPTAIALDAKAFDELLHAGARNSLLTVTIDGSGRDTALVREIQRDPITRRVVHADLQRVRANEAIVAAVPLAVVGIADGVKNAGGVLDVLFHTIDIKGPANAVPEQIELHVEHLGIHDKITAGDLKLPSGFAIEMDAATILVAVEPSAIEAQAAVDGATLAEAAATAAAEAAPDAASEPTPDADAPADEKV